MSDFVEALKSVFDCPCKKVNIKDYIINMDLRPYYEESSMIEKMKLKSRSLHSQVVSSATSKDEYLTYSNLNLESNSFKVKSIRSIESSLLKIDFSKQEEIFDLTEIKNQISKYLYIDLQTNRLKVFDHLFKNNFRLTGSIPLKAEISLGLVNPMEKPSEILCDISLGNGVSHECIFNICLGRKQSKDDSASINENYRIFIKTNDRPALNCELKSSTKSFEDQLSQTLNSNKITGNSNKIYFQISKAYVLKNNAESFVVLGTSHVFRIKTCDAERTFNHVNGFESDFSDADSSAGSTLDLTPQIRIKKYVLGTRQTKEFTFKSSDFKVTIGRNSSCDIPCADPNISKIHLTLFYCNEISQWIMMDGHDSRRSANGSWVLLERDWCCEMEAGVDYYFRYEKLKFCLGAARKSQ